MHRETKGGFSPLELLYTKLPPRLLAKIKPHCTKSPTFSVGLLRLHIWEITITYMEALVKFSDDALKTKVCRHAQRGGVVDVDIVMMVIISL